MKCPYCYVNYDDSERECPMCGRAPSIAAVKRSKATKKARQATFSGSAASSSAPVNQRVPHTHARKNDRPTPKKPCTGQQEKKKGKKAGVIIAILVVLMQLLPVFMDLIGEVVYEIGTEFPEVWVGERTPEPMPEPAPETPVNVYEDSIIPEDYELNWVAYVSEEGAFRLEIADEGFFRLSEGEHLLDEGFIDVTEIPADYENAEFYYNEEFDPAHYAGYELFFMPMTADEDGNLIDGDAYSVMVFDPEDGGGSVWFSNWYADCPWLPLDREMAFLVE